MYLYLALCLNYTKLVINNPNPDWGNNDNDGLNYTKLVINDKIEFGFNDISNCLNYTKLVINSYTLLFPYFLLCV
ncbi:Uncharacterised protein [Clostridioides difficile]|nr:Uncharacterised protein [Clostridioides difficile]